MTYILGIGSIGNDVRRLQEFLNRQLPASLVADGSYGGLTKTEVLHFRSRSGLPSAPTFDEDCFRVSAPLGYDKPQFDTDPAKGVLAFPKAKSGLSSPTGADMQNKAGKITFTHTPQSGNPEHITITNGFEGLNIVVVDIPQLKDCVVPLDPGVTKSNGKIRFHKKHAARLVKLFESWNRAGFTDRILTFDGAFNARLKRGSSSATVANLSNHSFGTAFDINAQLNMRKTIPAMMGDRGCVRELVSIANDNGFFWGGHFRTKDGMHFEIAAEFL